MKWRIYEQCVPIYWILFLFKNVTLHISHVFYDNYTRISAPPWHESPGVLCHFLLSALGGITLQGYRVISGQIFWYVTLEASWYMYNVDLSEKYHHNWKLNILFLYRGNATNCHFTCQFDIWQVDIITCIWQVDEIIWHVDMKI